MKIILESCPFCGKQELILHRNEALGNTLFIHCDNPDCGAVVSFQGDQSPQVIARKWNTNRRVH